MDRGTKVLMAAGLGLAVAAAGAGIAIANGQAGSEQPLTGSDKDRAVEAALAYTGGGTVLETEVGDDGAAYGVEIRTPDGNVVEVHVDASFEVVGSENDDDSGTESTSDN